MSDSLNITPPSLHLSDLNITNSNGSLHLSDLHVTDPSQLNNTTLESLLTNNSFTINFTPPPPPPPVPFNVNVESIPNSGEVHDIELQNGHEVHGNINGNIPFTATLQDLENSILIEQLNSDFSNSSFTRDETDNETDDESNSNFSFSATGGKKKRSTKKRKGKKKRTTKKRKGKKKKKTMRKQRKRSKKRRGGDNVVVVEDDSDDEDDDLNSSKNYAINPEEYYNIMNPTEKRIYNFLERRGVFENFHVDDLADNYKIYEKKYQYLNKKLSELEKQNGEKAKELKNFIAQLKNTLNKMENVSEQQAYAILFNYYLDPNDDKYNIHVNSGLENEITELQRRYEDYINFEASQIDDDDDDVGLSFGGGKKKRKKNKSKKKQKK